MIFCAVRNKFFYVSVVTKPRQTWTVVVNWSTDLNHCNHIMVIVVKNFIAGDFVESKNISQDNTINRLVDNITVFV